jgi:PAS domain S-box-containing protein
MRSWKPGRTIRIPLIYGVFSIIWIIASDQITYINATSVESATLISILKGTAFVLLSTLLIFLLLRADEKQQASLQTELKKVQDSFSHLFAKNPQPMWINDSESYQFLVVNEAACKLYGYSQEEFLNLHFSDLLSPDEASLVMQTLGKWHGGMQSSGPWKHVKYTGEIILTNIVIVNLDYGGRKANLVTTIDISQQKQIEETLKKTENERDDFEAFGYSVSHDLRAQLRAVTGYSQILLDDYGTKLDNRGNNYLFKLQQASLNMNKIVDNLLVLSRISHKDLHAEWIDLSGIVRQITTDLQTMEPGRKVEFVISPGCKAFADANVMEIAMKNLLENAWKYTTGHEIAKIEFGCQKGKREEMIYFVKDDGAGFDPTKTALMFKPFQRFHVQTEFTGSGVGLSIVAKIIERHQGKIWAEGRVEKGATFFFTLGEVTK